MAQNNTDIILRDSNAFGDTVRKIELDDRPSRTEQFKSGLMHWLLLPSNPVMLSLDGFMWINGSALILSLAAIWSPAVLLWGIWSMYLIVLVCAPTALLDSNIRVCAFIRLMFLCLGAVALIL